jgi:hypothetical protein
MSESPYFIFCEKKKCRKNEKKISCVEKRREKKKKRVLFFREDNFRDIVRVKKKENLSMMRVMYQAANVIKAW